MAVRNGILLRCVRELDRLRIFQVTTVFLFIEVLFCAAARLPTSGAWRVTLHEEEH